MEAQLLRVQSKDNLGPYRCMVNGNLLIEEFSDLRDSSSRHPSPYKDCECGWVEEYMSFGFLSPKQLADWFFIPEFDHIWGHCGIAIWRAHVLFVGRHQVIFDRRKSLQLTFQTRDAILASRKGEI